MFKNYQSLREISGPKGFDWIMERINFWKLFFFGMIKIGLVISKFVSGGGRTNPSGQKFKEPEKNSEIIIEKP